jgi:ABC-type transport system involved in cytochrome c biogenesis permease component
VERDKLIPRLAVALYVAYWIAVLFGYLRLDSSDFADGVFELLRAAALVLPALALGFLVGRWQAVLVGLVFLVAVALPERTVVDGNGVDVTLIGTYGVSLKEALALIAVTTPCVILGVVARRAWIPRISRPTSG